MFRTQTGEATAPKAVRLDIADFLVQRLGAKLTAESLLMHLNDLGFLPLRLTGERAVRQRIQALNQHYLNEVGALLINQTEITRQECGIDMYGSPRWRQVSHARRVGWRR